MKKYKHKATSIEEVSDRNFITESEIMSVNDIYSSNSQTVNINNIGTIESTIEGTGKVGIQSKSMINLLPRLDNRYDFIVGTGDDSGDIYNTNADWSLTKTSDGMTVNFNTLDKGFTYSYIFTGGNNVGHRLMPKKQYTFFFDIYFSKPYTQNLYAVIQKGNHTGAITDSVNIGIPKTGWNRMSCVFTTTNTLNSYEDRTGKGIYIWMNHSADSLSDMSMIVKNAMLIEGNIPLSEYPGYFEGYTSCLDQPAKITSCSSNHLDITKLSPSNAIIMDTDPSRGYIKFKKVDNQQGAFIQFKDVLVERNTYYKISYDVISDNEPFTIDTYVYSENDTFYSKTPLCIASNPTFNTNECNKIDFGLYVGAAPNRSSYEIFNLRLTKGSDTKEFEPYRESVITIDALSLKELPTGVRDTIEGNKLTRRVGKLILNGSEKWGLIRENDDFPSTSITLGFTCTYEAIPITNIKHYNVFHSDLFPNYGSNCMYAGGNEDYEQIGTWSHGGSINIRINRDKNISDIDSFKSWLRNNPVTVYYELDEPTVEYIDTFRIGTYEGVTHIKTDSNFFIPLEVTTNHSGVESVNSMKDEIINQNNKLSSLKEIQFTILNNLI